MDSVFFMMWFSLFFRVGLLSAFPLAQPHANDGQHDGCRKRCNPHQHIAAGVLPQQHRAEAAPCGGYFVRAERKDGSAPAAMSSAGRA